MIVLIYLLIGVGAIIATAGGVWFLVVAFRTGIGWGLACLFIPFAAIVYVITHWKDAKLPFLVNLGGALITVVAVMGLAGYTASTAVGDLAEVTYEQPASFESEQSSDTWWQEDATESPSPEPVAQTDDVLPEPTADLDPRPTIGVVPREVEAAEPTPEPTSALQRRREWGRAIELNELEQHVGQAIEIHTLDGKPFRVILEQVNEDSIEVKDLMGSGHVAFSVAFEKITELRVKAEE